MALAAIGIALSSMRFLTLDPEVLDEALRPNLLHHPIPLYIHTTLAPLALIIGVWQSMPVTRRSAYHMWAGRVYVVFSLIAALAGFTVAFTTTARQVAGIGFAILAVMWFSATRIA